MERGSAEALHEKASQHYLNGEFAEALAAWEALLRLDPADERGLEGTRLSRMMVGPEVEQAVLAEVAEAPSFEIDHEALDLASPRAPVVLPDPIRQSEGIDFGDVASVPALALDRTEEDAIDAALLVSLGGPEAPAPMAAPTAGTRTDLLEMEVQPLPPSEAPEVAESALAPFQAPPVAPAAAPPAQGELSRRLSELLAQAGAAAEAGNLEEAKALLGRIAVLDEDNLAAQALAEKLREQESQGLRRVDDWIVEGVQWFEQGRLTEARDNFQRVLELMPDHLEAQDYVRRIDAAGSAGAPPESPAPHVEEDFLASLTSQGPAEPPPIEAVPLASPSPRSRPPAHVPAPSAPVAGPAPVSRRRLSPVVLIAGLTAAAAAGWFFLGPNGEASDIPAAALTDDRPQGGARQPVPGTAAPAPAAAAPLVPPPPRPADDPESRIAQATARGDWSAAIVAYNEVLAAHPDDVVARAGLLEAGQRYREQRALQVQLDQVRRAFADGEYAAALRLLYRMPMGIDAAMVEGAKVAGWVNLGIVELKAGDPDKAISQLQEALALRPQDEDAKRLLAFAQDHTGKTKDTAYRARVEAMEFRPLPN